MCAFISKTPGIFSSKFFPGKDMVPQGSFRRCRNQPPHLSLLRSFRFRGLHIPL